MILCKTVETACLILENGCKFKGKAFGHIHDVVGEVVFTTNMTGYQETLTDPSFCGQIVVMTYPLIGNYGINFEDMESDRPALSRICCPVRGATIPAISEQRWILTDFCARTA